MGKGEMLKAVFHIHGMINRGVVRENELLNRRKEELNSSTNVTRVFSLIFSILAAVFIAATFMSNVSLRKKGDWLEGLLETILNTSQDGIVYYQAVRNKHLGNIKEFKIVYANPAIKLLVSGNKNVSGKARVPQLESFIKDTGLFSQFSSVIKSGNPLEMEILYEKNDNRKWLNIILAKMEDGITATFHDITSLKDYQEELKQKIAELERSNAELEEYAYAASHDLQEPLRKIKLHADILQSGAENLATRQQDSLGKILKASQRMTTLITDLLSYSSLKNQHTIDAVDLNEVLRSVLDDMDVLVDQKKAKIEQQTLPIIEGIASQLGQLFYNLVHNALKFSAADRAPVISIRSRHLLTEEQQRFNIHSPNEWVVVVVEDNGVGFNPDYADNIFGMFKRLHTRQQYEGSGIGLALVRKVIENHNGFIYTNSGINKGASFFVLLPFKKTS
jgi:signal transduction histidine kinase